MQPHDTESAPLEPAETTTLPTSLVDRLYVLWDLAWQLSNLHDGRGAERPENELWDDLDLCLGELVGLGDDATSAATLRRENDRLRNDNEAFTAAIQEVRQLIAEALAIVERQSAASADQALTDLLQSWGISAASGRRPRNGSGGEIAEKSTDDGQESPER